MTKQLLKLFGFPFHTAPGEAEAECALLQREGIVNAVLSEDVDTLMFGCGKTLRNWTSEGSKGNHAPTHVSLYDANCTKLGKSGLDREGMILIALMSGGDYVPEGVSGCGIKVACEAARAGFGASLCKIPNTDTAAFTVWRATLQHELRSNERKFFRVKHKALVIPTHFPDLEVLGYYTNPVVSSSTKVQELKTSIVWNTEVDVLALRDFTAEAFEWINKAGAIKFIRGLAPALLVAKMMARGCRRASGHSDLLLTAVSEMKLVRAIHSKRTHFSSDGLPELRLIFHPLDIVPIDLDAELDDLGEYARDGLGTIPSNNVAENLGSSELIDGLKSHNGGPAPAYLPTQPAKVWVPETIAKVGIPVKVQDYEESLRDPRKFVRQKASIRKAATKCGMPRGALDAYVQTTKPSSLEQGSGMRSGAKDDICLNSPADLRSSSTLDSFRNRSLSKVTESARRPRSAQVTSGLRKPDNPWVAAQCAPTQDRPKVSIIKAALGPSDKLVPESGCSTVYPTTRKHLRPPTRLSSSPGPKPTPERPESPTPLKKRSQSQTTSYLDESGSQVRHSTPNTSVMHEQHVKSRTVSPDANFPEKNPMWGSEASSKFQATTPSLHKSLPEKDKQTAESSLSFLPEPALLEQKEATLARINVFDKLLPTKPRAQRFLMLRQSLEGSWSEVDEVEKERREGRSGYEMLGQSWQMNEVEVVDLTKE